MTDYDPTMPITALPIRRHIALEISSFGYETLGDIARVDRATLLRIPGVGGRDYKTLMRAVGREPFEAPSKRKRSEPRSAGAFAMRLPRSKYPLGTSKGD